jgi:hypothetical protein
MNKVEGQTMSICFLVLAIVMMVVPPGLKAQECYVEIYSVNPDYVQVSVDTHGIENNVLLSDVNVKVSYRVDAREASKTWAFTNGELPSLRANKVYRRYLALNEGPAVEITGGGLDYVEGEGGARYDTPSIHKDLNPGTPPENAQVIGALPPVVGVPPAAAVPPAAEIPPAISGEWRFTTHSSVSGETHSGILILRLNGNSVTGNIETLDRSNVEMTGTYDADSGTLTLNRDTGLETIQKYSLRRRGAIFAGKFWNEGRYEDSGTIEIVRQAPKAPPGMRVEVH